MIYIGDVGQSAWEEIDVAPLDAGGLEMAQYRPHSRPSSYIPMGLDATVSYPRSLHHGICSRVLQGSAVKSLLGVIGIATPGSPGIAGSRCRPTPWM